MRQNRDIRNYTHVTETQLAKRSQQVVCEG